MSTTRSVDLNAARGSDIGEERVLCQKWNIEAFGNGDAPGVLGITGKGGNARHVPRPQWTELDPAFADKHGETRDVGRRKESSSRERSQETVRAQQLASRREQASRLGQPLVESGSDLGRSDADRCPVDQNPGVDDQFGHESSLPVSVRSSLSPSGERPR